MSEQASMVKYEADSLCCSPCLSSRFTITKMCNSRVQFFFLSALWNRTIVSPFVLAEFAVAVWLSYDAITYEMVEWKRLVVPASSWIATKMSFGENWNFMRKTFSQRYRFNLCFCAAWHPLPAHFGMKAKLFRNETIKPLVDTLLSKYFPICFTY